MDELPTSRATNHFSSCLLLSCSRTSPFLLNLAWELTAGGGAGGGKPSPTSSCVFDFFFFSSPPSSFRETV